MRYQAVARCRASGKSNTIHNALGSQSWRDMVDIYTDDLAAFKSGYRQRSIMGTMFGAITMYGNGTRCHKPENQGREIAKRIICYNIELAARSQVKHDRPTPRLIAAMAA